MNPLYILVGLIAFAIFISALRNKVLREIGFRNILRRKSTTTLIIFGSLIGTALIAGSLTLGDSFAKSNRIQAENILGEIDAQVSFKSLKNASFDSAAPNLDPRLETFSIEESKKITSAFDSKVDGFVNTLIFNSSVIKSNGDPLKDLSLTSVDLIAFEDKDFSKENLKFKVEDGKAIISQKVAQELDLKVGDKINIFTSIKELTLTVQEINSNKGASSYTDGNGNIIVSHKYLAKEFDLPQDSYNRIFVSSKGSAFETSYNGSEFKDYISKITEKHNNDKGKWNVKELKAQSTTGGSQIITSAFLVVSFVGVIAGILLIINIYTMLAEERKSEMGTLRAIAFTRSKLIKTFVYEGFIYSVISSVLGVVAGVGIGYLLLNAVIAVAKNINKNITITFDTTPETWSIAFCLGLLVTFGTSFIASYRISKVNIVSAIRNLPDEKDIKITAGSIIKLCFQLLILVSGLQSIAFGIIMIFLPKDTFKDLEALMPIEAAAAYNIFFGLMMTCFMLSILGTKYLNFKGKQKHQRLLITILNVPLLLLACFIDKITFFSKIFDTTLGSSLLLVAGLTIVLTSTLIVIYNLDLLGKFFQKIFNKAGRFNGIVKLSLRYASENKMRTGLTLVMFALVLFLVGFLSVFRITIDSEFERFAPSSGYEAYTSAPKTIDVNKVKESVEKLGLTKEITINKSVLIPYEDIKVGDLYPNGPQDVLGEKDSKALVIVFGFDENFIKTNPLKLSSRAKEFKNDDEALKAALNTGKYVFLSPQAIGGDGLKPIEKLEVGKTVKINDGTKTIEMIVGGLLDPNAPQNYTVFQYGMLTGDKVFTEQISKSYVDKFYENNISFKLSLDKKNKSESLKEIKKALIPYNIADNLFSISAVFETIANVLRGAIIILQGFLSFSLFVGIAGIAIIMTRSVNERKQQIGMLRSLGFQRSSILQTFFFEASIIILLGVIVGILSGVISANVFINALDSSAEGSSKTNIVVPYLELIYIAIGVYIVSIIFTLLPSYQASKLSPVEATNYLD